MMGWRGSYGSNINILTSLNGMELWTKLWQDELWDSKVNTVGNTSPPRDSCMCLSICQFIQEHPPCWNDPIMWKITKTPKSRRQFREFVCQLTQTRCKAFGGLEPQVSMWCRKNSPCNLTDSKKGTKILREDIHDSKNYGWCDLAESPGNSCVWKDLPNILGLNSVMKGPIWNHVVLAAGWGHTTPN